MLLAGFLIPGLACSSLSRDVPYFFAMPHNVSPLVTVCSARQDGGIMLRGVVDAYEISLSHQGLLMSLEGRGIVFFRDAPQRVAAGDGVFPGGLCRRRCLGREAGGGKVYQLFTATVKPLLELEAVSWKPAAAEPTNCPRC